MQMIGFADKLTEKYFIEMFNDIDKDGSGEIEKCELKQFVRDLTSPTSPKSPNARKTPKSALNRKSFDNFNKKKQSAVLITFRS